MVGFAADHRADGDQRVEFGACARHLLQRQRNFQRAGHGGNDDIVVGHAQFDQFLAGDFEHGAADFIGKTRLDDADTQAKIAA